ncbi:C13 family peptidase [Brevundimonas aurifodinae]
MLRIAALVILVWLSGSAAQGQSRFDGWASAIVAADWRTTTGEPIQAFDNARRDLTAGFLAAGFSRDAMVDVTLRPDANPVVTAEQAVARIGEAAARAPRGCFLYITSHGSPEFVVFGPDVSLTPTLLATLVRGWCGDRPTVLVLSACFSGAFIDGLAGPNRMILTAARRDRASFGCSEDAIYPYFDGCVIERLPTATDFIALGNAVRACVKDREEAEGLAPASEPQVFIGANMQLLAPTLRFDRPS